jgi:EAL domain-containing protein (putative c-di-GMP-specific phosphodiesterase class I)
VENSETLQILKELKVDYAQGYAIHKPQLLSFENKKVVQL